MTNPYQSLRSDPSTSVVVRFNSLRMFFFVANFSVAVTIFVMSVVSIVTMESLQSFIGGLMCVFPSLTYGVLEWVAYVRENRAVER